MLSASVTTWRLRTACDHVHLLGVTLSSDLSLYRHSSIVSTSCCYWLRQLQRSLDVESASTLVDAFVASQIDLCNALLANSPKAMTDKLQRVLNAAA